MWGETGGMEETTGPRREPDIPVREIKVLRGLILYDDMMVE